MSECRKRVDVLQLRAIKLDPFNIAEHTTDPKLIAAFRSAAAPVRIMRVHEMYLKSENFSDLNLEQSP
jgi:hypothetical protein